MNRCSDRLLRGALPHYARRQRHEPCDLREKPTPSSIDRIASATFTIAGDGFAEWLRLPVANFNRGGVLLGQARALTLAAARRSRCRSRLIPPASRAH
jgi:hypothetical protein